MPIALRSAAAACLALAGSIAVFATTPQAAEVKVEADLSQTVLPTSKTGSVYLRLSLKSLAAAKRERDTRINTALVIDRSGSMGGDRIAAAKEGARVALERLPDDDTIALVAYNHEVQVLSDAARLGRSRDELASAIKQLRAGGTTALYAGVEEGGRQVEEHLSDDNVNRVILLSDGLANVGPSSPHELARLGRKLASRGITVSTIGLGLDYNEDLIQRLAPASDGNHVFVERPSDLAEIFDREFGDALSVAARDIDIIIECRLGFEPIRILGRDGKIDGNRITLKMNQLQSENERYVVVELKVPEGKSAGAADIADVRVDYVDLDKDGKRVHAEARPRVRFSADAKAIEGGLNKTVMSQVAAQIATERSEEAVALRDKGDIDGARRVLEDNAAYIKRSYQQFGTGADAAPTASIGTLNDLEKQNRAAAENLDADNWNRTRKALRYDQHKAKSQQAY